ncbi:hypothetical protein E1A91_A06G213400v1, partial [Gossypium mustelinum]
MHWKGLWALFSFHGEVKDAFIPIKKSKSGTRFGFVRYSSVIDAQRAINRLNGFVILGYRISVKMASFRGRRVLKQNDWAYLKECFISIEPWSEKRFISERVTWIEVAGIPLHCWNYETFKRVAGLWGKLISMGESWNRTVNFEKMEMMISVNKPSLIDELVFMEVGNCKFPIRI